MYRKYIVASGFSKKNLMYKIIVDLKQIKVKPVETKPWIKWNPVYTELLDKVLM